MRSGAHRAWLGRCWVGGWVAHRDTPSCMHHQVDVGAVVVLAVAWRGVTSSSGMGIASASDGIAKGGGVSAFQQGT